MRRRAHLLIALLAGCGNVTDSMPPDLGECALSTPDWWPLVEGTHWVYDEFFFRPEAPVGRKDLIVQRAPASILGLLGDEQGIRTWRTDRDKSGWRWFIDDGSATYFRRDVLMDESPAEVPCPELGPDDDPRTCAEVTPSTETYFLDDGRKRLDYRRDRVCEQSAWTETYVTWEVPIGEEEGECPRALWAADDAACAGSTKVTIDRWSVVSIARHIEVPAGIFEGCLCVRRRGHEVGDTAGFEDDDKTYCFAQGVGKVYELDRRDQVVECLAQVCRDGACEPATGPSCNPFQLDDG